MRELPEFMVKRVWEMLVKPHTINPTHIRGVSNQYPIRGIITLISSSLRSMNRTKWPTHKKVSVSQGLPYLKHIYCGFHHLISWQRWVVWSRHLEKSKAVFTNLQKVSQSLLKLFTNMLKYKLWIDISSISHMYHNSFILPIVGRYHHIIGSSLGQYFVSILARIIHQMS